MTHMLVKLSSGAAAQGEDDSARERVWLPWQWEHGVAACVSPKHLT